MVMIYFMNGVRNLNCVSVGEDSCLMKLYSGGTDRCHLVCVQIPTSIKRLWLTNSYEIHYLTLQVRFTYLHILMYAMKIIPYKCQLCSTCKTREHLQLLYKMSMQSAQSVIMIISTTWSTNSLFLLASLPSIKFFNQHVHASCV